MIHDNDNPLNIPPDRPLPGRNIPLPLCIIGDDAFSQSKRLMKPLPGNRLSTIDRIFNYRISRARRVVENVFGITSAKFRVLRTTQEFDAKIVSIITCSVCALHNFLMDESRETYMEQFDLDLIANNEANDDNQNNGNNDNNNENVNFDKTQRTNEYKEYFISVDGEMRNQLNRI